MDKHPVNISYLFQSAQETKEPEEAKVEGHIPEWLTGSFLQIGPGLFDFGDFAMNYWLDGYGIISKFDVNGSESSVKFCKKYVHSDAYLKALAAGSPCITEFGTRPRNEGNKNIFSKLISTVSGVELSDNCSASLFEIGPDLFAAASTCFFRKINSANLESGEKYDAKKLFGQNGFGVHPLKDSNGDIYNMGFSVLPTLKYNVTKIPSCADEHNLEARLKKSRTLCSISSRWSGALAFNHSFGLSKRFIIFVEQPYVVRVSRVLSAQVKGYSCKEWLDWCPQERNRFYIIEKSSGRVLNTEIMSHESFFFLHIVNCYEEGDQVIVDIVSARDPFATDATNLRKLRNNEVDTIEPSAIHRYVIPTTGIIKSIKEGGNLVEKRLNSTASAIRSGNMIIVTPEAMSQGGVESVSINRDFLGKKHTFMYSGGTLFSKQNLPYAHSVCKLSTATKEVKLWTGTSSQFPGPCEPIFVPRNTICTEDTEEDDGIVISPVTSADPDQRDFLLFLDAKDFVEIARVQFQNKIPCALHGIYLPNTNKPVTLS